MLFLTIYWPWKVHCFVIFTTCIILNAFKHVFLESDKCLHTVLEWGMSIPCTDHCKTEFDMEYS